MKLLLFSPSNSLLFFDPDGPFKTLSPKTINYLSSPRLNCVQHIQNYDAFISHYPELRTVRKLNIGFILSFR